ncbi:hypothetical protein J4442_04485 [Candidatus Woesearchaeota archaeon]|nr:hypothetical protein [Candidatus Woesearchaeota archaeon]
MTKKGMTWGTITGAILAIVILLILVLIFREQISAISEKFLDVIKQTGSSGSGFSESLKEIVPEK